MGLCRTFSLWAEEKNGDGIYDPQLAERIMERLETISGYPFEGTIEQDDQAMICDVNWYDWDDDMAMLAKEFPEIVFTLHCDGMSLDDTFDAGFCGDRRDSQGAYIPDLNYKYLRGVTD